MSLLEYLQRDPSCSRLAEGAVHCVAPLLLDPDPRATLEELEGWADQLVGRMPLPWNLHDALDALNQYLFVELKFRGDHATYEDPANAVLPEVLVRRKGLPITLSILWIDLARRLGFDAVGVGLPGHFIAGLRLDVGLLCFDPFHRGVPVGEAMAAKLVERATGGQSTFTPGMLKPAKDRAVLGRLVRNLHLRFVQGEAWDEALWTSTHLVLLSPSEGSPYRDRALVHLHRGDRRRAEEDMDTAASLGERPDEAMRAWLKRLG